MKCPIDDTGAVAGDVPPPAVTGIAVLLLALDDVDEFAPDLTLHPAHFAIEATPGLPKTVNNKNKN